MEKENENSSENGQPTFILFPVCVQSNNDGFMCVLRAIVGRTNIEKNPMNRSLINGMTVPTIKIEAEDIGPWTELNSDSQQLRQAMMLGYWAIKNFPLLGTRLCGDGWNAPQRRSVTVVGRESMTPDEFDTLIFNKTRIRIIELHVTQDTLQRLKHFVKTPPNVGKENRVQLSKKIFSFDIQNRFERQCWDALRSGEFSCRSVNDHVAERSEVGLLTNSNMEIIPDVDQQSCMTPNKKRRRDHPTDNDAIPDAIDHLFTAEPLRTILVNMQTDLGNLTKWLNPEHGIDDSPKQTYLKIITEKDVVIDTLKRTADDLRKEVENLKNDRAKLNDQVETNAALISALQRGVDANFKLLTNSETQLTVSQDLIVTLEQNILTKNKELETANTTIITLQSQLHSFKNDDTSELNSRIEALEQDLSGSNAKNVALDKVLQDWKSYGETKEKEIRENSSIVSDLKNEVEMLLKNNTESDANNSALERSMQEWKSRAEAKDKELESEKAVADYLKIQLNESNAKNVALDKVLQDWKSYGETKEKEIRENSSIVSDLKNGIEMLLKNNTESDANNSALERSMQEWKSRAEAKDKELESEKAVADYLKIQLNESNAKNVALDKVLQDWKSYGETKEKEIRENSSIVSDLKNEVEMLLKNNTESDANNSALERSMQEWKCRAESKDKELENEKSVADYLKTQLNDLNKDIDSIVPQMNNRIEEMERNFNESTAKNGQLEMLVNELKVCVHAKDEELGKAELVIVELRDQLKCLNDGSDNKVTREDGRMDLNNYLTSEDNRCTDSLPKQVHELDNKQGNQNLFNVDNVNECEATKICEKIDERNYPTNALIQFPNPNLPSPEVLKSEEAISVFPEEADNVAQNDHQATGDDPIVRACKPVLMAQRFGWVKFKSNKNSRFWPSFVYSPDEDGYARAQKVTADGYVADEKHLFSRFEENVPENEKCKTAIKALSKFNEKFNFTFA